MRKAAQLFIAWIEIVTWMLVQMTIDRQQANEVSQRAEKLIDELKKVGTDED